MLSKRQLEERKIRQERILSSALEVFRSKGIDGTTMDLIAENGGKRFFRSKYKKLRLGFGRFSLKKFL